MVILDNLTKTYESEAGPIQVVENVDLRVPDGEFLMITGRSGSGKTTLLSMIGGLTRPTSGRVTINDVEIWTLDDPGMAHFRNQEIGFVFQFPSLIPTLRVIDNVLLPSLFAPGGSAGRDRALELLSLVQMREKAMAWPSQLSGGQQKRVAIARALINQPRMILGDEPTADLDEDTEREIMGIFREINRNGVTVLLVTHALDYTNLADRVLTMSRGKLETSPEAETRPERRVGISS